LKKTLSLKEDTLLGGEGRPYSPLHLLLCYLLFFVSGFSSLVYEVVWSRMLVLVMGNTTLATTTILVSFMAGLSLGGYYWGSLVEKGSRSALFLFGALETGTGIAAIIISQVIWMIIPSELWIAQTAGMENFGQATIRLVLCFCILIIPTFLMGGTLAVIGRHLVAGEQDFGRTTAALYGINTAGALLGAFLSGFFLIHALGHNGSLILAACLNLLVGIISMGFGLRERKNFVPNGGSLASKNKKKGRPKSSKTLISLVLFGVGISGFCGIAYQILWTRWLILIIDNSVYSFTLILTAFLAGIALGSLLVAPCFRVLRNPIIMFAIVEISIGISAFFFPFFIHLKPKDPGLSYLKFLLITIPLGILPPTVLMGVAFPLGAQIYQSHKGLVGKSMGTAYSINTAGSVLGGVAACFVFIGQLGFQKSALILPGMNLAIGALIALTQVRGVLRYAFAGSTALLILMAIHIMPHDYFRQKYGELEPKSDLIYYKESLSTTATIFERPDQKRVLYLNGIPELDTSLLSVRTFKFMGALPGLLHRDPKNALMITFGAGITAGTASLFVDHLDCVDLAEQAREIAAYFRPLNDQVVEKKTTALYHDDARHYLHRNPEKYSIIISDATHPRVYDSGVLFTDEFYRLVQKRLSQDGIFLQWLPLHGLELKQYLGIIHTFSNVFSHTSIWCVDQGYSILLSTPQPLQIDLQAFQKKLLQKDIQKNLGQVGLDNPYRILSYFVMGEKKIQELLSGEDAIMTDNNPGHLFFPFHATFDNQYANWPKDNYLKLKANEETIVPFLENISDLEEKKNRLINIIQYFEAHEDL
jgi:spermidine synthase